MITDNLLKVSNHLEQFLESDVLYDQKIHKHISRLSPIDYNRLLQLLCNQKPVSGSYSLYKVNMYNKTFSHHLDTLGEEDYVTLQNDNNHLLLNIHSIESLILSLSETENRYFFVPVLFSTENRKSGHIVCLIIDIIQKHFYLYDPNGKSTFFNNIFSEFIGVDTYDLYMYNDELIDILIQGYVNEFNKKLDLNYKFVSSKIWNPYYKIFNTTFDENSLIGSGHCVITTILFLHYLMLTNLDVQNAFNILISLNNEERAFIISSYSCWLYEIYKPYFDKKMNNIEYRKLINEEKID